ncbi:MAG: dienelactone hydrolase family protein [Jatrophihabitans sp.]|uniref:dienelactone hydrolase family protein n=1 Tax=Jatrophihabitans sp. TaxID=1932789 RepID=UPI003F81A566
MPAFDLGSPVGGSRHLTGHLALPAGDGPWPGVVVIHEAFGLDDVVKRQADRLAAAGYLALAPDLFTDGSTVRCVIGAFRSIASGRGKAFADIEAARVALAGHPDCTGKVGVIGFCMGGAFALLTAQRGFDASSVNYGVLPKDLDAVLQGACPIVASYGMKDTSLRGAAAKLERGLTRAGVEHDVKEYPSAGHSFLNDAPNGPSLLRPLLRVANVGPEPTAAADAWQRIETFFGEHLH